MAFEGLEVGSVCVKWVQRPEHGAPGRATTIGRVVPHNGAPRVALREILERPDAVGPILATGQATRALVDLPYRPETECLERALAHLGVVPDLALSLGGETFSAYPMRHGAIKDILSSSKCAAGTGEFMVQQFHRMGFTLQQGLAASQGGKLVPLASRCSVHCKSDVTHKLNKGECTPADIAQTLVAALARRVAEMVEATQWPAKTVLVAGGVALNERFLAALRGLLPGSQVLVLPESPYLEAFGASVFAAELPATRSAASLKPEVSSFARLPRLQTAEARVDYRVRAASDRHAPVAGAYVLGVDAGSTTTKAALVNLADGTVGASVYLRTLGNPVKATRECLRELSKQVEGLAIQIVQVAVTGSGRELVSVLLDNALSFNEILAHARAAAEEHPGVDTVFEIGGQDSKFISFLGGVPIDYAMNEGCSAGTGSFLEESASVDLGVAVTEISRLALESTAPLAFGERCAAFINTDLRTALQQGAAPADAVAGLVYSIADNYISRVVGPRPLGKTVLLQGGVALNKSVALAIAHRAQRDLIVPPHPELMGCVGAAGMARDLLRDGRAPRRALVLGDLIRAEIAPGESFRCKACDNLCDIQRVTVQGRPFPFGGLCSKYERVRHHQGEAADGRDLVAVRNAIVLEAPRPVSNPRGRIGLPLALTSFELLPFYAKLIEELGYEAVLSKPSKVGNTRTRGAVCYPGEIAHGAVYDLLERGVDFVLLPHVLELPVPQGALHSYVCTTTSLVPDLVRAAFGEAAPKLLTPHVGLSDALHATTLGEIEKLGARLGVGAGTAREAGVAALAHYQRQREVLRLRGEQEAEALRGKPTVVLAGRPYVVASSEVNLALPRLITSRGFNVVPMDLLPRLETGGTGRDAWHFTQQITNAVEHVRRDPQWHLCLVSCFSCGPDATLYHFVRQRLAGLVFCYLEIDSHTARAGFETRVGAFLDIVETRRSE